ncbi:hypothetical protein ACET3Z_007740 [Daucus carota]
MILPTQSSLSNLSIHSPIIPLTTITRINSSSTHHKHQSHTLPLSTAISFPQFKPHNAAALTLKRRRRCGPFRVLSSVASPPAATEITSTSTKPSPAEVSRTIMELTSVATLSTLTPQGFPLGIGVRFAVEPQQGTPILCLNPSFFPSDSKSSLHVQLEQCGLRTPQCTIQGCLDKPQDASDLKKFQSIWKKRFNEDVDEELIHIVAVERILQTEDFMEDGVWFTSLDYKMAVPDPLRDYAESIIQEINTNNMEDIHRFCNVYVDLNFQVSKANMIWVDRLGFDVRLTSPQNDVFEVRIPFPREVTDEKGAKSSFNCMSQLAWEMEKHYHAQDYKKVNQVKKITSRSH